MLTSTPARHLAMQSPQTLAKGVLWLFGGAAVQIGNRRLAAIADRRDFFLRQARSHQSADNFFPVHAIPLRKMAALCYIASPFVNVRR